MIKIKLKNRQQTPSIDEAAKWRSTSFNTEFTEEELQRLIAKYGADVLGAHYDDGVPTGKQNDSSAAGAPVRSREKTEPQKSFNPKAKWETPTGVYYYPLSWAKDEIFAKGVPFAGDKKYVYIYKIKDVSKRIDATELCKNGFIENAIYWASKNADLSRVLSDSNISGGAFSDILRNHGGGLTYGDPSKPPEENIYVAIKTYFFRSKEAIKTHFNRRLFASAGSTSGFDWRDVMSVLVTDLPAMASRAFADILSVNDKHLLPYAFSRQEWINVSNRVLKELRIEEIIKGLDNSIAAFDPKFKKALELVDASIENYYSGITSDQLLNKKQYAAKNDKPMPAGTIELMFKVAGKDDATIANQCFYIINNMMDRNVNKVTKYFISQGYEVLEDREGTRTIHPSEPHQGIYLTTRIMELVGVYLNRNRAGRMKGSYIDSKEMDPKLLRSLLSGENGKALVDQAFQHAKKYPEEFSMLITYMLNNDNIPKNKKLANQIANEANPDRLFIGTIGKYIDNFASVLSPDELNSNVSKLVTDSKKEKIKNAVYAEPKLLVDHFGDIVDTMEGEYGSDLDFNKYPTLLFLRDSTNEATLQNNINRISDDFLTYDANLETLKKRFPLTLKRKVSADKTVDFYTAVSDVVENPLFKNKSLEDRAEFIEWLFDTYPQAWKDDAVIRAGLSSMRYLRSQDAATQEEEDAYPDKLKATPFYKKLFVHWEEMKKNPELMDKLKKEKEEINKKYGKPQGITTESRFKKLNRIGRYSMLR